MTDHISKVLGEATTDEERAAVPAIKLSVTVLVDLFMCVPDKIKDRVLASFLMSVVANLEEPEQVWAALSNQMNHRLPTIVQTQAELLGKTFQ
jgi:hypothetical protein